MDKKTLFRMRLDGHTYQEIANRFGVTRQYVQQVISPSQYTRKRVVKRYDGKCANCGLIVGISGHVHHKGCNIIEHYNSIENLVLLCPTCHRKAHSLPEVSTEIVSIEMPTYGPCLCCGHGPWVPRKPQRPVICPHCKSKRWDKGRIREAGR